MKYQGNRFRGEGNPGQDLDRSHLLMAERLRAPPFQGGPKTTSRYNGLPSLLPREPLWWWPAAKSHRQVCIEAPLARPATGQRVLPQAGRVFLPVDIDFLDISVFSLISLISLISYQKFRGAGYWCAGCLGLFNP